MTSFKKNIKKKNWSKLPACCLGFGWKSVKLYFMLGLPTETEEDLLRHC